MGLLNFRRKQSEPAAAKPLNDPFSGEQHTQQSGDPFEQPPGAPGAAPVQPIPPRVLPAQPVPPQAPPVEQPPVQEPLPNSEVVPQEVPPVIEPVAEQQLVEQPPVVSSTPETAPVEATPSQSVEQPPIQAAGPVVDEFGVEQPPLTPEDDPFEQPLVEDVPKEQPVQESAPAVEPVPEQHEQNQHVDFQVPEVLMQEEEQVAEATPEPVVPDAKPVDGLVVMHEEKKTAIYVEKRQYQQLLLAVADAQDDIRESADHLARVLDDENIISAQVESWHDLLNDIQENLIAIDMRLFEKGDDNG